MDDSNGELEELKIDRQRRRLLASDGEGGAYAGDRTKDSRLTALINWVWAALGAIGLMIGAGMYNKLSNMNDTLLLAVAKLETQGNQISELRVELSKQRDETAALRSQVYMLEGKTLRGIQEATRGH